MCMIDDADGDWTTLDDTRRVARKRHRCCECGRMIEPGETYRTVTGVDEYGVRRFKTCAHCLAAAEWLMRECRGYLFEAVGEDLREHFYSGAYPRSALWLGRCIVSMRRRWTRRDGTLMPVPTLPERESVTA